MDYGKLAACAPINTTAAMVMSKGEHWTPKATLSAALKDAPKMKPPSENDANLIDQKWGRLRVIGKAAKRGSGTGGRARWVLRCACGNYLTVKAATINERKIDRCDECDYLDQMRAGTLRGMRNCTGPGAVQARREARGVA